MSDRATEPTTKPMSATTVTAGDLITTVPGKRKHAFYVTPDGAAPATTPRHAPLTEAPRPGDELEAAREQRLRVRLAYIVMSIAVTIGTYAISSATSGRPFLIASAALIAGVAFILRASR